jgi:hypothetical protein
MPGLPLVAPATKVGPDGGGGFDLDQVNKRQGQNGEGSITPAGPGKPQFGAVFKYAS